MSVPTKIPDSDVRRELGRISSQLNKPFNITGATGEISVMQGDDGQWALSLVQSLSPGSTPTFKGIKLASNLTPTIADTYDIGTMDMRFRKGWISELDALVFAKNTITLNGGWYMTCKNVGVAPLAITAIGSQIDLGQTGLVNGDMIQFRAVVSGVPQLEWMRIGACVGGSYPTTYNMTRDLDGSGQNAWPAGMPFAVLGQVGNGWIDVKAYTTPQISVWKTGTLHNNHTEVVRLGDLNGIGGVITESYGIYIGTVNNYLKYDSGTGVLTIAGVGSGITSINGANIQTGSITANQIASHVITAAQIASGTITASEIAASTITGGLIAAGTIAADRLNVTSLSAISSNMGTLTAGTITGGTIYSTLIRSSLDNKRIEISNATNEMQFIEGNSTIIRLGSNVLGSTPGMRIDGVLTIEALNRSASEINMTVDNSLPSDQTALIVGTWGNSNKAGATVTGIRVLSTGVRVSNRGVFSWAANGTTSNVAFWALASGTSAYSFYGEGGTLYNAGTATIDGLVSANAGITVAASQKITFTSSVSTKLDLYGNAYKIGIENNTLAYDSDTGSATSLHLFRTGGYSRLTISDVTTLATDFLLTSKITTYNNVATLAMGTAPIYGFAEYENRKSALTWTALANTAVAGTYRISVFYTTTFVDGYMNSTHLDVRWKNGTQQTYTGATLNASSSLAGYVQYTLCVYHTAASSSSIEFQIAGSFADVDEFRYRIVAERLA